MRFSRRVPNQEYYDTQYDEHMYALHGELWTREKYERQIAGMRNTIFCLVMTLIVLATAVIGLSAYLLGHH